MNLTDDEKAAVAITTRLGDRTRPSLTPRKWHLLAQGLRDEGLRPGDLFHGHFPPLASEDLNRVKALLGDATLALVAASELMSRGIWILTLASDSYPDRCREILGPSAPPVLFGVGAKELLADRSLGIVGSRDVEEVGAKLAVELATEAAKTGWAVTSGAARGVDQLAMNGAFSAGGSVLGIVADSLQQRIRRPEILSALDSGRTCLITQQSPDAAFTPGSAMSRNKLIYAIATMTVVVASDLETGGTWAGAIEALKHGYGRVAVYQGTEQGRGNDDLIRLGASPLTSVEDLAQLLEAGPAATSTQLRLVD